MKFEPGLKADSGRFALLWHEIPRHFRQDTAGGTLASHWDLLLEMDGPELLTFRLDVLPPTSLTNPPSWSHANGATSAGMLAGQATQMNQQIPGLRLPNHRPLYLDYEGPIAGDRGTVQRIAAGTYHRLVHAQSMKSAPCEIVLASKELAAHLCLPPCEVGETVLLDVLRFERFQEVVE